MTKTPVGVESLAELRSVSLRDVMTADPMTVTGDTRLSDVVDMMENRDIMHFPVVEDGKLVGMLSERYVRDALPSVLTLRDPEARRRALRATRVAHVCRKEPPTITVDAGLLTAISTMRAHKAGCLPIVDGERLVGILTSGDLITLLEKVLTVA